MRYINNPQALRGETIWRGLNATVQSNYRHLEESIAIEQRRNGRSALGEEGDNLEAYAERAAQDARHPTQRLRELQQAQEMLLRNDAMLDNDQIADVRMYMLASRMEPFLEMLMEAAKPEASEQQRSDAQRTIGMLRQMLGALEREIRVDEGMQQGKSPLYAILRRGGRKPGEGGLDTPDDGDKGRGGK